MPAGETRTTLRLSLSRDRRIEPAPVGLLPDGKPRARCPPGVHHFVVGPRRGTDPLEEIEDQGVDGVGHGTPTSRRPNRPRCVRGFYPAGMRGLASHGTYAQECPGSRLAARPARSLVVAACAVGLAACSSGGSPSTTATSRRTG